MDEQGDSGPVGATTPEAAGPTERVIPPLRVSGLVVSIADLVAALRLYVPGLVAMSVLDGDRVLLQVAGPGQDDGVKE